MGAPRWPPSPQTFGAPRRSRGAPLYGWRARRRWLLAGAGLHQELDLVDGRAPQRVARLVVGVAPPLAELVHRLVLLVGRGHVERLGADERGAAGGGVRALHPASDLAPVLVEEDDDRDRL